MNYTFQFCDLPGGDLLAGGCDYMGPINGELLPPLDERSLDECVGIGSVLGFGPID